MNELALRGIAVYQRYLSRTLFSPFECAFPDTCSRYALRAFQEQTFLEAMVRTRKRLKRCSQYGIVRIQGQLLARRGILEIAGNPDRAQQHIDALLEAEEPACVIGHVLGGSQTVYLAKHGIGSPTLDHLMETYDVKDMQPRIRELDHYKRTLRQAAAVRSLYPLPLLGLTLLPHVPSYLVLASVACFVGQRWYDSERTIHRLNGLLEHHDHLQVDI